MKKLKNFSKKYLIGIILGLLSSLSLVVWAAVTFPSNEVSYSNVSSGLNSNNVQGAIDELYKNCKGIVTIYGKDFTTVTSGDGLYKDENQTGKYVFRGKNPLNFIKFNNELWRIISMEKDGSLKIVRNETLGKRAWDTSNSNNWARPASLNTYLNGEYYNSLTSSAKNQIVEHTWGIGTVTLDSDSLSSQISEENSSTWNGKIALIHLSDYINANSNTSQCNSYKLVRENYQTCADTNYLIITETYFTLSPAPNDTSPRYIKTDGNISSRLANTSDAVRPSVYLSSDIQITGGNGSSSSPYTLS